MVKIWNLVLLCLLGMVLGTGLAACASEDDGGDEWVGVDAGAVSTTPDCIGESCLPAAAREASNDALTQQSISETDDIEQDNGGGGAGACDKNSIRCGPCANYCTSQGPFVIHCVEGQTCCAMSSRDGTCTCTSRPGCGTVNW